MEASMRGPARVIRGNILILGVAAALLALTVLPSPSVAALGCLSDGISVATCSEAADCGPVGGTDCTSGFCLCSGESSPFCACAAPEPVPAASHLILVLMVGLLTAIATFELRRRAKARQ